MLFKIIFPSKNVSILYIVYNFIIQNKYKFEKMQDNTTLWRNFRADERADSFAYVALSELRERSLNIGKLPQLKLIGVIQRYLNYYYYCVPTLQLLVRIVISLQ
jgi:hypothetical protein